jgi:hypothetical protein
MSLGVFLLFIMVCPRSQMQESGGSSRGLGVVLLVLIVMLVMRGV